MGKNKCCKSCKRLDKPQSYVLQSLHILNKLKNIIKLAVLQIQCKVLAEPAADVNWKRGKKTLSGHEQVHIPYIPVSYTVWMENGNQFR